MLPEKLEPSFQRYWDRFKDIVEQNRLNCDVNQDLFQRLKMIWACSEYVAESFIHDPKWFIEMMQEDYFSRSFSKAEYDLLLKNMLLDADDIDTLNYLLRQFKRRYLTHIIWRDLDETASLHETLLALSDLADVCIGQSLAWMYQFQSNIFGVPTSDSGEQQELIIIAVGKLGGQELNLSSDVDLIFCYPEEGHTQGRRYNMSSQEFFARLGQALIKSLETINRDGFVYRVDMRLRPHGYSGPLVVSMNTFKHYYLEEGRPWERYALVKARFLSGASTHIEKLEKVIKSFVYRTHLDYSAIDELRHMKHMIEVEVKRNNSENNIKLGSGGIREIEFIVQTFQLIKAGRYPSFQTNSFFEALGQLEKYNMSKKSISELEKAYIFLRRVENRLQAVSDLQIHKLPESEKEMDRLVFSMNMPDWDQFFLEVKRHRKRVHKHFSRLIEESEVVSHQTETRYKDWQAFWQGKLDEQKALGMLKAHNYIEGPEILSLILNFQDSDSYRTIASKRIDKFSELMAELLELISETNNQLRTWRRMLPILESLIKQKDYFTLLIENHSALKQLVILVSASPWIASQMASHITLLDELIDKETLLGPLNEDALRQELQDLLRQSDDENDLLEILRRFKNAQVLHVAAADMLEVLPIMKVSDHLTFTARAILNEIFALAWDELTSKHGKPPVEGTQFIIVAYGKLAGIELGYGSDLDLVFIQGVDDQQLETDGEQAINCSLFYNRLAQRILTILNKPMSNGVLYQVDMRLRPAGDSGLLVSSLNAFERYQERKAWTWEHQALVRSCAIVGDSHLAKKFEKERARILSRKRDTKKLQEHVIEMREKMRKAAVRISSDQFDLKQGKGGIADIEFIVQYAVLNWSHQYSSLIVYPDNIRILEALMAESILTAQQGRLLCDAYQAYRDIMHRKSLQNDEAIIESGQFLDYREEVSKIWCLFLEEN